ncbi:MAG TPA: hypothetical protein VKQ32_09760 [Polyangia bacterium]|nr:hypothetical protein [Polyangia bacterium]
MNPIRAGGVAVLLAAWTGTSWAQGGRPSDADIFGGSAPAPAVPPPTAPAKPPAPEKPAAPPAPETPVAPAGANQPPSSTPPAAAAEPGGTSRDQSVLGEGENIQHLSDYQAPENPLQIGGQIYLRTQSSAFQGGHPLFGSPQWALSAPSLLDVYLDARPNPRVRAFVLGRMSFDPTRPVNANTTPLGTSGGQGAFVGTSATGFTTFSTGRGPNSLLDQMWIRFDVLETVFVTAGKQHVRWGTGRFWQPTDYLHALKRNPLDVFDARGGTSMLKLHVPWESKGWNFYGVAVTEDPTDATASLTQVAAGGRAELIILGAEVGLDALFKRYQRPRAGIDISTGIGDFDVYADVAIRAGEDFNVVYKLPDDQVTTCETPGAPPGAPPALETSAAATYGVRPLSGVKTQTVLGANYSRKYNDNDMWTVGAEYFYNQPGYTDASLYPGLLSNNTGVPQLNFFYTGRHYAALFASFPAPYSWNYTTFTLSTIGNISDRSFVSRLDYSLTVLTHLTLEAFAAVHFGYKAGEFRLGADFSEQTATLPGTTPPICFTIPAASYDPLLFDFGVALRLKI